MEKQPRALRMGDIVWERSEVSTRITVWRFEFQHIRSLVCQELRGIGTRHAAGEINDAHTCKRAAHMTSFLRDSTRYVDRHARSTLATVEAVCGLLWYDTSDHRDGFTRGCLHTPPPIRGTAEARERGKTRPRGR